jgi:hypothetical protein
MPRYKENRNKTQKMKTNGYDRVAGRVNGHATISPSGAAQEAPQLRGRAASDDTREFPNAAAASSAAAGTERAVYAEVARPPEGDGNRQGKRGNKGTGANKGIDNEATDKSVSLVRILRRSVPLAKDGPAFVDEMHSHVDLYIACARLVKSKDEKIAQRMVERLLEMSYGKSPAPPSDEVPQLIIDAPRPIRD